MHHSTLLEEHLIKLQNIIASDNKTVLDLACGSGRNGLYLIENNIPVTFADVNNMALSQVKESLHHLSASQQKLAHCWQVDFEQTETTPLQGKSFAAVMVFRYLHRPLFEQIKAAIQPGGVIIYETFTTKQAQFGRPTNPDFLLAPTELVELFSDWQILHSFEGIVKESVTGKTKQAIAQIVAIKPTEFIPISLIK